MRTDNIKDLSRYVVNELHHGSICPGNRAEMWRDIYLENGATVKGGIFGASMNVLSSGVTIEKSVYIRGEIRVDLNSGDSTNSVTFGSTVISPDSLVVEGNKSKAYFNSDIYVDHINISNSIVYGNIYCKNAIISNSIILGGIYCKNKLTLEQSIVYTFSTRDLSILNNVSMLSPFGYADKPFSLEYPVRALTFFDLKEREKDASCMVVLEQGDVFELRADTNESDSEQKVYMLSIVERVLNTTEIIESFKQNKKIIEFLSLGSHLDPEFAAELKDIKREDIEKCLWEIIQHEIQPQKEELGKNLRETIRMIFADH